MAWWIWILAGLVLLGLEALAPGPFFCFFLGVAGLLVGGIEGVASALGTAVDLWVQLMLFSVLAVLGMVLFRRRLVNAIGARRHASVEVDAIEGQETLLFDALPAGAVGKAELRGTVWNVRNAGDIDLAGGTRCRVERVDGLTLIVKGQVPGATSGR